MKTLLKLAVLMLLFLPAYSVSAAYDIRNDFCGVHINFQYCKCAFHNEYCGAINLSQSAANSYVQSEFNAWVAAREEAAKRAECQQQGGTYTENGCDLPKEEEPVENDETVQESTETTEISEEANEDETADNENEKDVLTEEEQCQQKEYHAYNAKEKTCSCAQLYRKTSDDKECIFNGDDGIRLGVEASIEFQETLEGLEPGQGTVFTAENLDGEEVEVGVIRKPDGGYEFTTDGVNYFDNAEAAVNPGWWQSVKTTFGDLWRKIKGVFGIDVYVGRDTGDDPEKQAEGQARLDASIAAFKDLRDIGKDPEKQFDDAMAIQKLWGDRAKELLGDNYEAALMNELKTATGYDVDMIKKVLTKDYSGLTADQIKSIKSSLYTFPADAVVTLAQELRKNDFAAGASLYMDAREQGKSPDQIYAELLQGQQPELEYKQLTGISQQYAQASMMLAYEDAYQRYLIADELE